MKTDVVVIGGSVAGSATAIKLSQKGIKSIIIEKNQFPRFRIGESLTGEAGKLLREWGLAEEVRNNGCYVKHGVEVYGPHGKNKFWIPVMARSEDGTLKDSSTWHVTRSEFDQLLLNKAKSLGTVVVQGQAVEPIRDNENGAITGVRYKTDKGHIAEINAKVLVDASGPATFLANHGITSQKILGNYDKQLAVFSHVQAKSDDPGTVICYQKKHHWAWYIPLNEQVVSVGVVTPSNYYREKGEDKQNFLRREISELNPELTKRLPNPQFIGETRGVSNYSYHIKQFTGKGFLCVGDSHRFIDPIFSFGVFFALTEADKAAEAVYSYLDSPNDSTLTNPFLEYQALVERGQNVIQDMIDVFWNKPFAFAFVAHQTHREDLIDIFAGRIYGENKGLGAIRKIKATL